MPLAVGLTSNGCSHPAHLIAFTRLFSIFRPGFGIVDRGQSRINIVFVKKLEEQAGCALARVGNPRPGRF
jgi:hypothetical protein